MLSAISDPDQCYKNKIYSNLINVIKTKEAIDYITKKNIYFIFFSTEFIFSGKRGNYSEMASPKPNQLYGKQKYLIEIYIKKKTKNFAILRIAKTYGDKLNEGTLISKHTSPVKLILMTRQ